MTLYDLVGLAPRALIELARECARQVDDYDNESQHVACYLITLRSISILRATAELLKPDTFDSWDISARAFLETRDLLTTFRFDDEKTRILVRRWFKGDSDAWKPNHKKCETFLNTVGAKDLQLAKRWGMFSAISHPTFEAVRNSTAIISGILFRQERLDLTKALEEKQADYMLSVSTLIATVVFESSGWIQLGLDTARIPTAEKIRVEAPPIVTSILQPRSDQS